MQGDGARLGSRLIDRIQKRRAANCSGRIDTSRLQPYRPDVSQAVHLTVQTSTAKSKKWTAPLQGKCTGGLVACEPAVCRPKNPPTHTTVAGELTVYPPTPVRNFHAQVVWRPANGLLQSSCAVRALAPSPIHNRDGCLLIHILVHTQHWSPSLSLAALSSLFPRTRANLICFVPNKSFAPRPCPATAWCCFWQRTQHYPRVPTDLFSIVESLATKLPVPPIGRDSTLITHGTAILSRPCRSISETPTRRRHRRRQCLRRQPLRPFSATLDSLRPPPTASHSTIHRKIMRPVVVNRVPQAPLAA